MTHGSLFSGIGGFELAAEWAGWINMFNCEIEPFCQRILKYYWPDARQYSDIRTTDFSVWRGRIDVLSGGFPCQPFSLAGKRKGTDDERHLWPEMLRAIREIRPRWIVGENVRGIVSWSKGMVFEQVCADLESEGYEVWPCMLPVAGVGGEIERYRWWFTAFSGGIGLYEGEVFSRTTTEVEVRTKHEMPPLEAIIAHDFRSESSKHGIVDGVPVGLDECSIHAYGNAVSPQVVFQIYETINEYEKLIST